MLRCKQVTVTALAESGILAVALKDLVDAALKRVRDLAGETLARNLAAENRFDHLLGNPHREPTPVRAQRALRLAATELGSMGISVGAVDLVGGGVRVCLTAKHGCSVDASRVRALVEAIVLVSAPDVDAIHVELEGKAVTAAHFVSISRLRTAT
jgi:hypothetical protein